MQAPGSRWWDTGPTASPQLSASLLPLAIPSSEAVRSQAACLQSPRELKLRVRAPASLGRLPHPASLLFRRDTSHRPSHIRGLVFPERFWLASTNRQRALRADWIFRSIPLPRIRGSRRLTPILLRKNSSSTRHRSDRRSPAS